MNVDEGGRKQATLGLNGWDHFRKEQKIFQSDSPGQSQYGNGALPGAMKSQRSHPRRIVRAHAVDLRGTGSLSTMMSSLHCGSEFDIPML